MTLISDLHGLGPDGPRRRLLLDEDTADDYGSILPEAHSELRRATANCFTMFVSDPATRPASHWDAQLHRDAVHARGREALEAPPRRQLHRRAAQPALLQEDRDGLSHRDHGRLHADALLPQRRGPPRPDGDLPRPRHRARRRQRPVSGTVGGQPYNCVGRRRLALHRRPPTDIAARASTTSPRRT